MANVSERAPKVCFQGWLCVNHVQVANQQHYQANSGPFYWFNLTFKNNLDMNVFGVCNNV